MRCYLTTALQILHCLGATALLGFSSRVEQVADPICLLFQPYKCQGPILPCSSFPSCTRPVTPTSCQTLRILCIVAQTAGSATNKLCSIAFAAFSCITRGSGIVNSAESCATIVSCDQRSREQLPALVVVEVLDITPSSPDDFFLSDLFARTWHNSLQKSCHLKLLADKLQCPKVPFTLPVIYIYNILAHRTVLYLTACTYSSCSSSTPCSITYTKSVGTSVAVNLHSSPSARGDHTRVTVY